MRNKLLFNTSVIPLTLFVLLQLPACTQMPDGNPDNGERWYRMNRCNGCHGEKGIGGKGVGGKGPVIAGLQINYHKFISKIREPDSAIMPAFEPNRLSDNDAADIYLWLKTLPKN